MNSNQLTDRQRYEQSIWYGMTPAKRDYDRFVARRVYPHLPLAERTRAETQAGRDFLAKMNSSKPADLFEVGCTCMMHAPCGFCSQLTEDEINLLWNGMSPEEIRMRRLSESEPDLSVTPNPAA